MIAAAPLAGQVAAVTGAGRGLGRVLAEALAAAGAAVVVNARRPEMAAATVAAIAAAGGRAVPWVGDVTAADAPGRMLAAAAGGFGRLDILVNNAAAFAYVDFLALDDATWQQTLATNLTAPFRLGQALLRHAEARGGGGAVLQVASVHAAVGEAAAAAQCAAKAGLLGLTRAMAEAGRPLGVRVNAISPGAISPAVGAERDREGGTDVSVSQRAIAQMAVLLLSGAAAAVSGSTLEAYGVSRPVVGA